MSYIKKIVLGTPLPIGGYTGSKGDSGSQGSIGYTGSAGAGFTGSAGFVGSKGDSGAQGFTGSIGYTGSKGDSGPTGGLGFTGSQGPLGYTGSTGAGFTGSQGYTGSKGDSGVQGAIGFTGSRGFTGSIGTTGTTGFTGSKGDLGFVGSRGFTGSQGAGFTGSQGAIGYTGSKGDSGVQGSIGFTGSKGDSGVQGSIGFTGSAGTGFTGSKGDSGIQGTIGYTGSQGAAITILGTVDSAGALPGGASTGDGYIIAGDLYVWDGSQYNNVGPIQGPTGFTGSIGFTGSQGAIGYTGSKGDSGVQGTTGFTGSLGNTGPIGYTGSQGAGFTGSQGYTGSKGDSGAIGYTGSLGNTGPIGYTGSQGDVGATGPTGFTGSKGDSGAQGPIGYTGSLGGTGFTGSIGNTGPIGYTGSKGDSGAQGTTGFTGSAGATGFTGSKGDSGAIGFTGSAGAGFTGSQGFTGSAGGGGVQLGDSITQLWNFVAPQKFWDGIPLWLGSDSDFQIVHNGSDLYLENKTGKFFITNLSKNIEFRGDSSSFKTKNGVTTGMIVRPGVSTTIYDDFVPITKDTKDVGSPSKRFAEGHFASLYVDSSLVDPNATSGSYDARLTVHNVSLSAINQLSPVALSAFDSASGYPGVVLADADSAGRMPCVGIAIAGFAADSNGIVGITGTRIGSINTSAWALADTLYVGTNSTLTNVAPTAGFIQKVAVVSRVDSNIGEIIVLVGEASQTINSLTETTSPDSDIFFPTSTDKKISLGTIARWARDVDYVPDATAARNIDSSIEGKLVGFSRDSGAALNILKDSTLTLRDGFTCHAAADTLVGTITLTSDSSVTVNGVLAGSTTITTPYRGIISIHKISTNNWMVRGDCGAVA